MEVPEHKSVTMQTTAADQTTVEFGRNGEVHMVSSLLTLSSAMPEKVRLTLSSQKSLLGPVASAGAVQLSPVSAAIVSASTRVLRPSNGFSLAGDEVASNAELR